MDEQERQAGPRDTPMAPADENPDLTREEYDRIAPVFGDKVAMAACHVPITIHEPGGKSTRYGFDGRPTVLDGDGDGDEDENHEDHEDGDDGTA